MCTQSQNTMKTDCQKLSALSLSLAFPCLCPSYTHKQTHTHMHTHRGTKNEIAKAHMSKKVLAKLRQAEMNRAALRAHSEKSTVRKTHITSSPPTMRGDECQEYARCIKRHRCYQSGLQEIPPNKVLLSSLQKWQRGSQPKQM